MQALGCPSIAHDPRGRYTRTMAHPYDDLDVTTTDFRAHPELYRIGRGEQGVLMVEPYKSELLPLWAFRTPEVAQAAAAALMTRFITYRDHGDFVGMDMARKYLQMGFTRARRYTNHRGGRKYDADGSARPQSAPDPGKAEAAAIFRAAWRTAAEDPTYVRLKAAHQAREAGTC